MLLSYSAKYSAERIKYAFEHDDFSEAALKPYEKKLRAGTEIWYEFIRLYYKLLPLFTHFINPSSIGSRSFAFYKAKSSIGTKSRSWTRCVNILRWSK